MNFANKGRCRMITRKENLVKEGTCQANSIMERNVTLLTAERPCLEDKAQGVKGLEHQWERPPATHGNEWNNCLLPACGAFMAKGCLILMASSHGALYLSIRNKEPPQLPPPPSSYPAQPCCGRTWWGIEHFCI